MGNCVDTYYFLGIGGIGMSALARYFAAKGFRVLGYDRTPSPLTQAIEAEGIEVRYDDSLESVKELDLATTVVVRTPAVPEDFAVYVWLKEQGFQILDQLLRRMPGLRFVNVASLYPVRVYDNAIIIDSAVPVQVIASLFRTVSAVYGHLVDSPASYRLRAALESIPLSDTFPIMVTPVVLPAPIIPDRHAVPLFLQGHAYLRPFLIGSGRGIDVV